jgi:hypothetical protein
VKLAHDEWTRNAAADDNAKTKIRPGDQPLQATFVTSTHARWWRANGGVPTVDQRAGCPNKHVFCGPHLQRYGPLSQWLHAALWQRVSSPKGSPQIPPIGCVCTRR